MGRHHRHHDQESDADVAALVVAKVKKAKPKRGAPSLETMEKMMMAKHSSRHPPHLSLLVSASTYMHRCAVKSTMAVQYMQYAADFQDLSVKLIEDYEGGLLLNPFPHGTLEFSHQITTVNGLLVVPAMLIHLCYFIANARTYESAVRNIRSNACSIAAVRYFEVLMSECKADPWKGVYCLELEIAGQKESETFSARNLAVQYQNLDFLDSVHVPPDPPPPMLLSS
jgi:hypothetical protein